MSSTNIRRVKTTAVPAKPRPDTIYDTPQGLYLGDDLLGGSGTFSLPTAADLTGATDSTAVMQAWASGLQDGAIIFWIGKVRSATITITAKVRIIGVDGGNGYGPTTGGTGARGTEYASALINTSTTENGLVLLSSGSTIDGVSFIDAAPTGTDAGGNPTTTRTAGSALVIGSGTVEANAIKVLNNHFVGWQRQVQVLASNEYVIANNSFMSPILYGLDIENRVNNDAGDPAVYGNDFVADRYQATAAVHFISGGGVKFFGNKTNAGLKAFIQAALVEPGANVSTSILRFTQNSFENFRDFAINVDCSANTATNGLSFVDVSDNEIATYPGAAGTAPVAFRILGNNNYVDIVQFKDNQIKNCFGIDAQRVNVLRIGVNQYRGTPNTTTPLIHIRNLVNNLHYEAPNQEGPAFIYQDDRTNATGSDTGANHTYMSQIRLDSLAVRPMYQIGCRDDHGLEVQLRVNGELSGQGAWLFKTSRAVMWNGSGNAFGQTLDAETCVDSGNATVNNYLDTSGTNMWDNTVGGGVMQVCLTRKSGSAEHRDTLKLTIHGIPATVKRLI